MEDYKLVYDFFETGNTFGEGSFIITIVVIAGLIHSIFRAIEKRTFKIIFFTISTLFMIAWNVIVHYGQYSSYNKLETQYANKEYKVVEGVVTNYSPMKKEGHGSMEYFIVDSIHFTFSDYIGTDGYNNSCVKGGVICGNGQKVRIEYYQRFNALFDNPETISVNNLVGNQILKIYVDQ